MYKRPVPVALSDEEISRLDRLAEELGLSRASLIRLLCRIGIRQIVLAMPQPEEPKEPCSQPHC